MDVIRKKQPLKVLESFPAPTKGNQPCKFNGGLPYLLLITDIPQMTSAFDIYHNLNIFTGIQIENVKIFKLTQNEPGTELLSKTLSGSVQLKSEDDYFSLLNFGNIQIKTKTSSPFRITLKEFYCAFEKRSVRNNLSRKILIISFFEFSQLPTFDQIKDLIKNPKVEIAQNSPDSAFYLSFQTVIDARDSKRVLEAMGMRPLLESEVMRIINFQRIEYLNKISADNKPVGINQDLQSQDFSRKKYPQNAFKFYFDSSNKIKQESAQTLEGYGYGPSTSEFTGRLSKNYSDMTENQHVYNVQFKKQIVSQADQIGLLYPTGYLSGELKKENYLNIPLPLPLEKLNMNSQLLPKVSQYISKPERSIKQIHIQTSLFEDLGTFNESLKRLYCELRRPNDQLHHSFNLRNNTLKRA